MKISIYMFSISLILFISCSDDNSKYSDLNIEKLSYDHSGSKKFTDYFKIEDTITIPLTRKNQLSIMYISKVIE